MNSEVNFNFHIDKALNHTTSHLLACAVLSLYDNVKLGFGPSTDEGFYYDFEFQDPISEKDIPIIEKRMHEIAKQNLIMHQVSSDVYSFDDQPYKQELFDEFKGQGKDITFYSLQDPNGKEAFVDLCAGGHVDSTKDIKHIKLLSLAGAFWRGNSDNPQLTRIYGTAWHTKKDLDNYLKVLEERKLRDHRKLGKQLSLFTFSPYFGQGFHAWLPKGMIVKNRIKELVLKLDKKYGFTEVYTPPFGDESLYRISGHLDHYQDDMFKPILTEHDRLIPRPMTCPHHLTLYNQTRHSYKEFPIRYSEQAVLFRYEKSGALTGLERVRHFELTEGHILIRRDQIASEINHLLKYIFEALKIFQIDIDYISFSIRDDNDEKYFNDPQMWAEAEKELKKVLDERGINYTVVEGEAAFYGPKIDFQVKSILNHEITISTLQLDFLLPERFGAYYIDEKGEKATPVLVHRGLIGTYERFISILLEQTKGNLPFWLAQNQFTIIPISDKYLDYSQEVYDQLVQLDYQVDLDDRSISVSKKVRDSQLLKTKYQIIIGQREVDNKLLSVRAYGEKENVEMTLDDLLFKVASFVKNHK